MNNIDITRLSDSTKIFVLQAQKLGYQIKMINHDENLFYISNGEKTFLSKNIDCGLNSGLGLKIADDKSLTNEVIGDQKYIPKSLYISYEESYDIDNIGLCFPLVVKPTNGPHGTGVTVDIRNKDELQEAIDYAFLFSKKIVVQDFIKGQDYRILVVGDKISAVSLRRPPHITGDGKSTIMELIESENKNPLRGDKRNDNVLCKIVIDKELKKCISLSNYTLESVLKDGEILKLRRNANLSTGGESIDKTFSIHPDNAKLCIDIAKKLCLKVAGIDILTQDISKSILDGSGAIIEVNGTPGFVNTEINTQINPSVDILNLRFNKAI